MLAVTHIWRAVTYQNAAILISEAELILRKKRVSVARPGIY